MENRKAARFKQEKDQLLHMVVKINEKIFNDLFICNYNS